MDTHDTTHHHRCAGFAIRWRLVWPRTLVLSWFIRSEQGACWAGLTGVPAEAISNGRGCIRVPVGGECLFPVTTCADEYFSLFS
jgi:hypothetical protein